ncbi:Hint domain-containing protein [Paracoccus isoporae]|uniref:Hint domain-containing protein n=1 Tax=Paracoccus isoporae TaxID=591205 RepID=A0A1G7E758_9RHOB|nr:Hint domain-containing protein [Paracoccus isoporae]SDE59320.1 Hint domain-containing protein [Paracoccus isoporae]
MATDPSGVNFSGNVYAFSRDMLVFTLDDPGNTHGPGTLAVHADAEPGTIKLSSPDTHRLIDDKLFTASGSMSAMNGDEIDFGSGTSVQPEFSWDFVGPDGKTYFLVEVIGAGGERVFISNYNLTPGETYNTLLKDGSPGHKINDNNSVFDTPETPDTQIIFDIGTKIDHVASPDGPGETGSGFTSYLAWQAGDVTIANEELTVASTAQQAVFNSKDNDDYLNDGFSNSGDDNVFNDHSQIGSVELLSGATSGDGYYEAENIYRVTAPDGTVIYVSQIDFKDGTMPDGSPIPTVYVSTQRLIPGVTYTNVTRDTSAGTDNPKVGIDKEFAPKYSELATCFARGTQIETAHGSVAVEDIGEGDHVLTADHGYQPVRWIGRKMLDARQLAECPNLVPIRIRAGALGGKLPAQDLLVSPQHRMLVRSQIANRIFGQSEVLVAAKQLVVVDGIDIAADVTEVEYFHLLFDQHEILFSNGAETESFYTGPQALKSVSPAAREEILTLFPELRDIDYTALSARPLSSGRMGRKLAMLHQRKGRRLVQKRAA